MIDLSTIPDELLIARGQYSMVRQAHEERKKLLVEACDELMSLAPKISRSGQKDSSVDDAIANIVVAHQILDMAVAHLEEMKTLAIQRAELKLKAWPK